MDPHTADRICHYADRWTQSPHRSKQTVLAEAMTELGISRPTFYRLLAQVRPSLRKRRADAGNTGLTRAEAEILSGYLMESFHNTGKQGRTLRTAIRVLRANGLIKAERVDPNTGELKPMSESAIARALLAYAMHPDQLNRPTPHGDLSYPHPNHTHQVDSSIGVIYYLKDGTSVYELEQGVHYKNKPWNIEAVSEFRVIRYVLIDPCTGVTRFRYYPKSESAVHTVQFLAWCWSPKTSPHDPFHGVPKHLYVDGGIANALVRRFCHRLGVELIVHRPKNSRATGSVEGAHNYAVEMPFEHGLRDIKERIHGFEDLNRHASHWQLWFNANAIHGRHKLPRFEAWLYIKPDELKTTCAYETLLRLATHEPKACRVQGNLTAQFNRRVWDVKDVPGIMVNGTVWLHWHPFIQECAMAVYTDANGTEQHRQLTEVTGIVDPQNGQWGFLQNAAEFAKEFKAKPDTHIDTNRKRIKLVASGTATQEADETARKRKDFVAFNGTVNPFIEAEQATLPTYIHKRGTALNVPAPGVELVPLTAIQAAKILKPQLQQRGITWNPAYLATLEARYHGTIPEADLPALLEEFTQPLHIAPKLAIVR